MSWCAEYLYVIIVSGVNKELERMIDSHALLLNHLDFSDPFLQQKLMTSDICKIITRSGKRVQYFHIWKYTGQSGWLIHDIIDALKSIELLSLQRFVLSGYSYFASTSFF
jgi:hypothetical protein